MSNLVKKWILDDIWAIGRNESWLSDMASQGLYLKKFGRQFAYFEKDEPKQVKYRIDILNEEPSGEQLEIYDHCGWNLAANNGKFYFFSSSEILKFTELHTDSAEQSYTLTDLDKQLKKNLIVVFIAILLLISMIFGIYFIDSTPFLNMIKGFFIQQMLLVAVELYVLYSVIRNYTAIHTLKKSLSEGKPINHNENWRKARLLNGVIGGFFISIALMTIFIPIIDMAKNEVYALPESNTNLPIVRLADIEQNSDLKKEVGRIDRNGIDYYNRVAYEWSLLAPTQYEIDEHGIIYDEMWFDKSGHYSPSIHTYFYKLTISKMAEGVVKDLIKRYVYDPNIKIEEVKTSQFDRLYIAKKDIQKQIFVIQDNMVIYINYFGNKNENDIIPLLLSATSET